MVFERRLEVHTPSKFNILGSNERDVWINNAHVGTSTSNPPYSERIRDRKQLLQAAHYPAPIRPIWSMKRLVVRGPGHGVPLL